MTRRPKPAPPTPDPEPPRTVPTPTRVAQPAIAFDDNPDAPLLFADEAFGIRLHNGVVTLTFTATHMDHQVTPGPLKRQVVARVVLPTMGAKSLAMLLYNFLAKNGLDPMPRPPEQTVQ